MFTKIRMRNEKGFTLIELLIVVAIIGILAAIAIPQFAQYRKRGYVAAIKSDLKNVYTASQAYLTDNPNASNISLATILSQGVARLSPSTNGYTGSQTMSLTTGEFSASSSAAACTGTITVNGAITMSSGC